MSKEDQRTGGGAKLGAKVFFKPSMTTQTAFIESPTSQNGQHVVCMFTLSNSNIYARNLPNNRKRKLTENIPHEKSLSSFPATLIGRLGVDKKFGGKGIGTKLIKFIIFCPQREN